MTGNESCENRIAKHLESRLDDLRQLWEAYYSAGQECPACEGTGETDNGECPTCEGNGTLDEEGNIPDLGNMYEYGLSFDYVAPQTFNGQDEGYHRYQLSWGGPSDEFRVYAHKVRDFRWSVYRIEYAFLDWFDGATRTLYGADRDLLTEIFSSFFVGSGTADAKYEEAMEDWEPEYTDEDEDY